MKVSSTQPAGRILPAKISPGIKTAAGDFFAVLAGEQGVKKSVTKQYQDTGSSHTDTGVKMKTRAKDDAGTKTQLAPLPAPSVPKTLPTLPITAPPASLSKTHDDSDNIQTVGDQKPVNPRVDDVSFSMQSAMLVENAYSQQHQAPSTATRSPLADNPGSVNSIHPQSAVDAEPAHATSQAKKMGLGPDLLPVTSEEIPATVPLENMPAAKVASSETAAQTHSTTGIVPTNVLNTKDNQVTRPLRNSQFGASTLDSGFQKSTSALQSRTEAAEAAKAAVNPVLPSSSLTSANDHSRQFASSDAHRSTAQSEEMRTQAFSSAGTDVGNHSSHHAKSEAVSSAPAGTPQDHPQNPTPTATPKPEVPPAVQVLHAAVASQAPVRETADRVSTPAAPGLAHTPAGPAHLIAEDGAVAVPVYAVHAARLVERLGESELRVGVNAGELGKVDIRTSMAHNQFTAEISVERGELGRVLAADLPNLHTRLSEQHLPTANITVQDYSAGTSSDHRNSQHERTSAQMMNTTASAVEQETSWLSPVLDAVDSTTGLDIHM